MRLMVASSQKAKEDINQISPVERLGHESQY